MKSTLRVLRTPIKWRTPAPPRTTTRARSATRSLVPVPRYACFDGLAEARGAQPPSGGLLFEHGKGPLVKHSGGLLRHTYQPIEEALTERQSSLNPWCSGRIWQDSSAASHLDGLRVARSSSAGPCESNHGRAKLDRATHQLTCDKALEYHVRHGGRMLRKA